jgi:pyruvate dehydrogenase E1 component
LSKLLAKEKGVFVAASDYMKVLPASISKWFPGPIHCLGTDGFGRSDSREELRDFFEVDAAHIAYAALASLDTNPEALDKAAEKLGISRDVADPETR